MNQILKNTLTILGISGSVILLLAILFYFNVIRIGIEPTQIQSQLALLAAIGGLLAFPSFGIQLATYFSHFLGDRSLYLTLKCIMQ